jgi:protease-4
MDLKGWVGFAVRSLGQFVRPGTLMAIQTAAGSGRGEVYPGRACLQCSPERHGSAQPIRGAAALDAVLMVATLIGLGGSTLTARAADPDTPAVVQDGAVTDPLGAALNGAVNGLNAVLAERKAAGVAVIRVVGELPETAGGRGLLGDIAPGLHRLIERIDQAAGDPRVGGVLLVIESPVLGRARALELRAAISRLRATGKPAFGYLVSGQPVHYAVASACDRVIMPPAATLEITGVRAEVTFLKAMLDKLGVQAEILQVGAYKGAGEPLTRTEMSPELRAQYQAFVGDLFEQLVADIASDRGLESQAVENLIDTGVFAPEAAREAGLIDAVGYEDEAISGLAGRMGVHEPRLLRDYGRRKFDADFSGLGGLMKLMELLAGETAPAGIGQARRVAIITLAGAIGESSGMFSTASSTRDVLAAIRAAEKDERVAAIVIRIDSPGGSALTSDIIWREVDRCEKPVVASLSDTAASGGYYVAVAADRIVAAPGTLTGSIGVVGGKIAVGDALRRIGVHTEVVSRGRNAGWLSMQSGFSEQEREVFLGTMREIYRLFTQKVATGRRLDLKTVADLAEGRVFTGRMALKAGLVDRLGSLEDAVEEARRLAGIDATEKLERLLLPEPKGLLEDLLGARERPLLPSATVSRPWEQLAAAIGVAMPVPAGKLEQFGLLTSGRPLMLLPAVVDID